VQQKADVVTGNQAMPGVTRSKLTRFLRELCVTQYFASLWRNQQRRVRLFAVVREQNIT
jgi:hypothetical protein